MEQLLWEPIPMSIDTSMVTTEWIMFELAKNPAVQEHLYKEIIALCFSRNVPFILKHGAQVIMNLNMYSHKANERYSSSTYSLI